MSSNNRSYSTNRFLSKTNPQFIRGLADSGSVLDSPEINKLAAQMVDLGIWDDLKLWVHSGLIKERVSGSDIFVPKMYDISDTPTDSQQTTQNSQPKLVNGVVKFDAVDDFFDAGNAFDPGTGEITIQLWIKVTQTGNWATISINRTIITNRNGTANPRVWLAYTATGNGNGFVSRILDSSSGGSMNFGSFLLSNVWYNVVVTRSGTTLIGYINGVLLSTNTAGAGSVTSGDNWRIMNRGADYQNGELNDLRLYNKALTATQIDAIFQATKSKYGY
jgi:hypothetical protein